MAGSLPAPRTTFAQRDPECLLPDCSVWHEREVPEILLSGHHANIKKWRREKSIERTLSKRPDMLEVATLEKNDKIYLEKLKKGE